MLGLMTTTSAVAAPPRDAALITVAPAGGEAGKSAVPALLGVSSRR
jgi:hypothetical protein